MPVSCRIFNLADANKNKINLASVKIMVSYKYDRSNISIVNKTIINTALKHLSYWQWIQIRSFVFFSGKMPAHLCVINSGIFCKMPAHWYVMNSGKFLQNNCTYIYLYLFIFTYIYYGIRNSIIAQIIPLSIIAQIRTVQQNLKKLINR